MSMQLITVGKRLPAWVYSTFTDYNKRMPKDIQVNLIEVSPVARNKSSSINHAVQKETKSIQKHLPQGAFVVLLDERGRQFSSMELACNFEKWRETGRTICFIIGGADGVDESLRHSADIVWSLSSLTFPHALVRVIVIEQIYRAWSIYTNHPYHRE